MKSNVKNTVETIDIPIATQTLTMAKINAGSFVMGSTSGDVYIDETPAHTVNISNDFYLAETQITNALFELYYPQHYAVRGKLGYNNMFNGSIGDTVNGTKIFGFSKEDDEAAVFISWNEAVAFCEWLNENYLPVEMKNAGYEFRLPTEAEWEYACRAGTATDYSTGDILPEEYHNNNAANIGFYPDVVGKTDFKEPGALTVKGHGACNAWGLYDMHGNVEEWVYDWYGPYSGFEQTDPVGPSNGSSKITRGGSHSTLVKYLRSANRSSAVQEDRNWMIGFRVALGKPIDTLGAPTTAVDGTLNYQQNVSQESPTFIHDHDAEDAAPYFDGPKSDADHYVKISGANDITGPFFEHSHQPAITECPNGDLLAIWYTGAGERFRELNYAFSRKIFNPESGTYSDWSPAKVFFDCADRNNHGAALFTDYKNGKVVFICGQSHSSAFGGLILLMRESFDNGASWGETRVIAPEYQIRQQAIGSAYVDDRGYYILTCDANSSGSGGSAFWISKDSGKTWTDMGAVASFKDTYGNDIGKYKSIDNCRNIAGIHAASAQVVDESGNPYYIAIGRGDSINGNLPLSVSTDDGATWTKVDTGLQKIDGLKRGVLKRLESGNILLVSFTQSGKSITLKDSAGDDVVYTGMYAALSEDNGKTWPYIRFLTDDKNESKTMDGLGNTGTFTMTKTSSEPKGYLTGVQTRDGLVHILSSGFEYTFNEAWVKQSPPSDKVK